MQPCKTEFFSFVDARVQKEIRLASVIDIFQAVRYICYLPGSFLYWFVSSNSF